MNKLPHFIIGGERRSGSTTLYKILANHPQINMFPIADMDYFIKNNLFSKEWIVDFDNDEEWYKTHSIEEYASKFIGLFEPDKIVGQKDADLLFWKPAHKRLKDFLPDTKFIFVLRDPIKRAESQFWNETAKGRETLDFNEAMKLESLRSNQSDYGKLHLNYIERGKYIDSINHFRKYYNDDQILIVILEKLRNNPEIEYKKISNFLGIDSNRLSTSSTIHSNHQDIFRIKEKYRGTFIEKIINITDRISEAVIVRITKDKDTRDKLRILFKTYCKESIRKSSVLDASTKQMLKDYYRKSIEDLESYIGYKIDEWEF